MPDPKYFPDLFDRIWEFFKQCEKLRKNRPNLTPANFVREFDKLIKGNSPAGFDDAKAAFEDLAKTIYGKDAFKCSAGGTRLRA